MATITFKISARRCSPVTATAASSSYPNSLAPNVSTQTHTKHCHKGWHSSHTRDDASVTATQVAQSRQPVTGVASVGE